jgi:transcriptional regulator with XRE-family HTH domain
MVTVGTRTCTRCRTRLARDNIGVLCGPCSRMPDHAPTLSAAEWHADQLRKALHDKDIGALLRAWRHHPAHGRRPVPQAELARWLGITQGQLSRIENGRNRVRDLDKLTHYSRTLAVPTELLWFELDDPPPKPPPVTDPLQLRSGAIVATASTSEPLADSLLVTLGEYVRIDNLTGPRPLLPIVTPQIRFIKQLEKSSRGRTRARLCVVRARFAEFLGWLHQDAGNLSVAIEWTALAATLARESRDHRLLCYIRMRQSNLAADTGNTQTTLALAHDALTIPNALPHRQRATALRQLAVSYARLGNARDCARALDEAMLHAAHPDDVNDDLAAYCTPEYIAMEAAGCLIDLGQPDRAITTLEPRLPRWDPCNHRDLGRGLALLAISLARTRHPENALDVAQHAVTIAAETHSTRTELQIYRVIRELNTTGASDQAIQLRVTLHNALQ